MSRRHTAFGHQAHRSRTGASSPSILFVSHDASRTGAPIALLTFLQWLRTHTDYQFEILLGRGGALTAAFASLAPTTIADATASRYLAHLPAQNIPPVLLSSWNTQRLRMLRRRLSEVDLVYSNTLQNGALFRALCLPGQRVLSHVHELAWWLDYRTPARDLAYTKDVTSHFIACSRVDVGKPCFDAGGVTRTDHLVPCVHRNQRGSGRPSSGGPASDQEELGNISRRTRGCRSRDVGLAEGNRALRPTCWPWSSDASPTQKFTFSGRGVRLPERPGEGS